MRIKHQTGQPTLHGPKLPKIHDLDSLFCVRLGGWEGEGCLRREASMEHVVFRAQNPHEDTGHSDTALTSLCDRGLA
ncbi:hypothetical protein JZ751_017845 [Albula glossodonta]|uniref:Uncharacterized protein n=1 Tax=Albula glossodonta TaxID=121402 RepID=A0A8T2PPJ7_9TELE|nr:hypothetical protein JZ751_017845 [Albula glossodonta]